MSQQCQSVSGCQLHGEDEGPFHSSPVCEIGPFLCRFGSTLHANIHARHKLHSTMETTVLMILHCVAIFSPASSLRVSVGEGEDKCERR